jgi:nicotinamidase-related amidase
VGRTGATLPTRGEIGDCPADLGQADLEEELTVSAKSLSAKAAPSKGLLTPDDHVLMMIDFQPQMVFATRSIDGVLLRNNAAMIAKAAGAFKVSTLLTSVSEKTFAGPFFGEINDALPKVRRIDRTTMNSWEDQNVIDEINRIGKSRIVVVGPTLSALEQGYEIYVIADACGDVTPEAHERAMDRMVQAGARPMTAMQYLLELQRDWARSETYGITTGIAEIHGGAYGLGIAYTEAIANEYHIGPHA